MAPRRARAVRGSDAADPAAALRAHLVAVTQRLLADRGLTGLTTRQIAQEAGVADGVLYNHFADKDDLVVTALHERFAALVADFTAARPEPDETALGDGLRALAGACLTFQTGVLPLAAGLIGRPDLLARFFDDIHSAGTGGPQQVLAAVADYVRAQQQLGRADPDADAHVVSALLFGATQLEALTLHLERGDLDGTAASLEAISAFLARGLRTAGDAGTAAAAAE